jgi:hypothetical protein
MGFLASAPDLTLEGALGRATVRWRKQFVGALNPKNSHKVNGETERQKWRSKTGSKPCRGNTAQIPNNTCDRMHMKES